MIRAFQWDLARQVERLDVLLDLLPRYAAWGYQELYLHLEDAVHYPSLPGVGRDDAYTYAELGELVQAATRHGIRVVPIANLLGHTQYLIRHPEWRDLNELRDTSGRPLEQGQVCPLHPRLAEVADRLLRDLAPFCTAGILHAGLDESFHLGRCPRCQEEVARAGLGAHFAGHVRRLHAQAAARGLRLGMWADMLYFVPEAIRLLPRGLTAYDWYYYPFARRPRVEFFNFAERDLAPALRRQGVAYYGCPMNGAFRFEPLPVFGDRLANLRSWWQRCAAVRAEGFLVTSWEAYRLALGTTTVVDAAAANLWLEPEADDATSMLARGLDRLWAPPSSRALARTLLAADPHAFAGYARWQINDRWDVFAGVESLRPYQADERCFARLAGAREPLPRALAASVRFRLYLARRDLFVRQAARDVFRLRRIGAGRPGFGPQLQAMAAQAERFAAELREGRQAARAMWALSRNPRRAGQNEVILDADAQRLRTWRAWLRRATRDGAITRLATPVCGPWQLLFTVHNFAPAVQKVVVEAQANDGGWRELSACFTIEFRAYAARPHSRLKREFSVPIDSPTARLRIGVRGVGQVAVSHAMITDGVATRRSPDFRRKHILGRPAPTRGLPRLDWTRNNGEMSLHFEGARSGIP